MAEYRITYWRNIPSMINARAGRRDRGKAELSQRFQVAIDEAAIRSGVVGTDEYLQLWRRSEWTEREGAPDEVAKAVAAELEAEYTSERLRELVDEQER